MPTVVKKTVITDFKCPECSDILSATAYDGIVQGLCTKTSKRIRVVVTEETAVVLAVTPKELTKLEKLYKDKEEMTKLVASAREDGDLAENASYTAAREQLSFINGRITEEEAKKVT